MQSIRVRHNMEMAHRLWDLPGKCTQIHGHSWWCELTIIGTPDATGILIDFGDVKKKLRGYLDSTYDHHLCLDQDDPLLRVARDLELHEVLSDDHHLYPGLVITDGMPTVENVSMWIGEWAENTFGRGYHYKVDLWEASTNAATWED